MLYSVSLATQQPRSLAYATAAFCVQPLRLVTHYFKLMYVSASQQRKTAGSCVEPANMLAAGGERTLARRQCASPSARGRCSLPLAHAAHGAGWGCCRTQPPLRLRRCCSSKNWHAQSLKAAHQLPSKLTCAPQAAPHGAAPLRARRRPQRGPSPPSALRTRSLLRLLGLQC